MRHFYPLLLSLLCILTNAPLIGFPHTYIDSNDNIPSINTSVDHLFSFREVYTVTVSDVQFYDLEARNLSSNLTLQADYPLKISLHCHEDFQEMLVFVPNGGFISERIYVRAFPLETGEYQPGIVHSASGSDPKEITTHLTAVENQIPAGYYQNATTSGSILKTQLHQIIRNHNTQTYSSLWSHYESTDITFSGKLWDMYSDIPCQDPPYIFTFGDDQDTGTGGNTEGDVFNREHSMPRSWFGGEVNPMNTDLHHIYPVDKRVNAVRANWPYGEVSSPNWISLNGGRLGSNSAGNTYQGIAFEPVDAYKGDLARSYFYMITRYEDLIENWIFTEEGNNMLDHKKYPGFQKWVIEMLVNWHNADPVSHKERLRNDAIYNIQGNRNPYIDKPDLVERIWGDTTLHVSGFSIMDPVLIFPNPAKDNLQFVSEYLVINYTLFSLQGKVVASAEVNTHSYTINLQGIPSGIYILLLRTSTDLIYRKISVF